MNSLAIAPLPPASVRQSILPEEWELCMDSWLTLTNEILLISQKQFQLMTVKHGILPQFLISYFKEPPVSPTRKAISLRKNCFLVIHRVLSNARPIPPLLLEWSFWADLSVVYMGSSALSQLLSRTWNEENMDQNASMGRYKSALIRALEVQHLNPELEALLPQTLALLRSCYPYGQFLMLGSDFIDALTFAYEKKPRLQKKIVTLLYFCFLSLMKAEKPRVSTLIDHLYSLNSPSSKSISLVKALVGSTPIFQKMQTNISGPESARARSLIDSLRSFEANPDGKKKKLIKRKVDKGKARSRNTDNHDGSETTQVHRLSLISQIQDLFPDLGSGFVIKLLDEYNDDTEQVIAYLLENSLPYHLKQADHSETITEPLHNDNPDLAPQLEPHSTPPQFPTRRNIYDDDEFDRLEVDTSKLHLGKDQSATADDLLASQRSSEQKAAILSALAAFNSNDDERDDTYDAEDVGGTVDTTNDEMSADLRQDANEEALFNAYTLDPNLFNRDAETRRSKARGDLKSETGMTDEALEGWAIMISRDPRRLDRLRRKFEIASGGQQRALEGTAWRGESGTEDSDTPGGFRVGRGGRARGRGAAGRGRGRGGEVTGPSDDRGTQVARQRKDVDKGSRANHNRRDQRARKMARGGFPG